MVGRAARRGNREIFRDFEVEGFVLSERDQCRDALQELIPETRDDVSGASRSGRYGRFRLSLVHGESCQVPPRMSLAIAGQHPKQCPLLAHFSPKADRRKDTHICQSESFRCRVRGYAHTPIDGTARLPIDIAQVLLRVAALPGPPLYPSVTVTVKNYGKTPCNIQSVGIVIEIAAAIPDFDFLTVETVPQHPVVGAMQPEVIETVIGASMCCSTISPAPISRPIRRRQRRARGERRYYPFVLGGRH